MRLTVIFPAALSIVALVLSFIALFAGHNPGFMEDYDIIRLNVSTIGHVELLNSTPNSGGSGSGGSGIGGFFKNVTGDLVDGIRDGINGVGDDIADKLAAKLGISQWYSLHLMNSCEGKFAPNVTTPGAWLNVTNCTSSSPSNRLNLTEVLDKELRAGPVKISLADIKWPSSIQKAVDKINGFLLAIFVLYVLAIGFSGLAMFGAVAAFFTGFKTVVVLVNLILAGLAALVLLVASIIIIVAARQGQEQITDVGESIGVYAVAGQKFIVISWVAFAMMAAASIYWFAQFFIARKASKRAFTEKRPRKY